MAGFQVSASVTSHETQPPAAPLPPEFSLGFLENFKSDATLLASGSLPIFRPSARRKGSLGSNAGLLVQETGFSLCSQVPSQTWAGP